MIYAYTYRNRNCRMGFLARVPGRFFWTWGWWAEIYSKFRLYTDPQYSWDFCYCKTTGKKIIALMLQGSIWWSTKSFTSPSPGSMVSNPWTRDSDHIDLQNCLLATSQLSAGCIRETLPPSQTPVLLLLQTPAPQQQAIAELQTCSRNRPVFRLIGLVISTPQLAQVCINTSESEPMKCGSLI